MSTDIGGMARRSLLVTIKHQDRSTIEPLKHSDSFITWPTDDGRYPRVTPAQGRESRVSDAALEITGNK